MHEDWEFESVAGPFGFTEGPVWDGEGVIFSDIPNDRIMRYVPETGECSVFRTGTNAANGLKYGPDGRLYACEMRGRRVARYDDDGGDLTVADAYEGRRLHSPNDLAFDSEGRLWFTDPYYDADWLDHGDDLELDHASVYRADPGEDGWTLARVTTDTTKPNGILVSPDDGTLYVAQSDYGIETARELRAYPIREDGSLGECDVLHDFGPHRGIDGMCFTEGGEIVATAGWTDSGPGPLLYVFAPTGRVLETHPLPTSMPTNCAFGGDDLRTLYVTGGDGKLHRARTDRRGLLGAP
jgi:gluconolactonase